MFVASFPKGTQIFRHDYQQKDYPSITSIFAITFIYPELNTNGLLSRPSLQSTEPTRKSPASMIRLMIFLVLTRPSLQFPIRPS
jgi:hypothetical protein